MYSLKPYVYLSLSHIVHIVHKIYIYIYIKSVYIYIYTYIYSCIY